MTTSRLLLLLVLAGGAALLGCKTGPKFDARHASILSEMQTTTVTNELDPALLKPSDALYTLGPGDTIEVELIGEAPSRALLTVGPDGRVYFDILPGVEIWGLTLLEAKSKLEDELKKYLSQPSVNVSLRNVGSKYVWMLGRFGRAGLLPMSGPMTLLEAMATAGGTESFQSTGNMLKSADLRRSFVMRHGQLVPVDFRALLEGDMSQNISLRPDDFVYIASAQAEEVYVLGGVRNARPQPFREDMTLLAAIAAAGGTLPDAYDTHIAIVRGSLTTPQLGVVNYRRIMKGDDSDVRLEPRDIVFVPWQPWRELKNLARQLVNTFVTTVAANAGARWVDPNAAPVGVSVNPTSGGGGGGGGK